MCREAWKEAGAGFACGAAVVCLKHRPRCGPTAHNTAVSRCQQHPWQCFAPALEAAYRVAAAATGFRRLLQPPSSCAA